MPIQCPMSNVQYNVFLIRTLLCLRLCLCFESCCSLDHQESRCNALDTPRPLSKTGPWLQVQVEHPTSTAAQTLYFDCFGFHCFVLLSPLNQLNSTNPKILNNNINTKKSCFIINPERSLLEQLGLVELSPPFGPFSGRSR
jgi:hypothetical protein